MNIFEPVNSNLCSKINKLMFHNPSSLDKEITRSIMNLTCVLQADHTCSAASHLFIWVVNTPTTEGTPLMSMMSVMD